MAEEFPHRRNDHQIENMTRGVETLATQLEQLRNELKTLNNTLSGIAELLVQTKNTTGFTKLLSSLRLI